MMRFFKSIILCMNVLILFGCNQNVNCDDITDVKNLMLCDNKSYIEKPVLVEDLNFAIFNIYMAETEEKEIVYYYEFIYDKPDKNLEIYSEISSFAFKCYENSESFLSDVVEVGTSDELIYGIIDLDFCRGETFKVWYHMQITRNDGAMLITTDYMRSSSNSLKTIVSLVDYQEIKSTILNDSISEEEQINSK